jgi:hypothetical protein
MLLYFCLLNSCPYHLNCNCHQSLDIASCCHTGSWSLTESSYWITGRTFVAAIHVSSIRCFITWRKWQWWRAIAVRQQRLPGNHMHLPQNSNIEDFINISNIVVYSQWLCARNLFRTSAQSLPHFVNTSLLPQYIRISRWEDDQSSSCASS